MKYLNYKDMALEVIEEMCLIGHPTQDLLETIYTYAHVAINKCKNSHEDWKAELGHDWNKLKRISKED